MTPRDLEATLLATLGEGALRASLPPAALEPAGLGQFATHLIELRRWGAKMNLTGSLEPSKLVEHTLDSLGVVAAVPQGSRVLDVGSGGGFPAIPLAIARPDVDLTLVEATSRKCAFLRHVIRALGLKRCQVLEGRLEAMPRLHGGFDVAVSRALMAPEAWLAAAQVTLRPTGRVLFMLAAGAPAPAGVERLPYELPGGLLREIGVYRRSPGGSEPGGGSSSVPRDT